MKRSNVLKVFVTFALFICFAFCGVNLLPASATIASPDINNNNYSSTYEMDKNLYNVIKAVAYQLNFNQPVAGFDKDIFTTGYNDYKVKESWTTETDPEKKAIYEQNIADSNLIKADLIAGELNLTVGKNAKYKCLQDEDLLPITDISGLNEISLDTVKTLILDNNQIKTITSKDFKNLVSLQNLSVKNNGLKSINLNSSLAKLNNLDLSNNNLTEVDLSKLVYTDGKYPSCNLSNNQIESVESLIFPTSTTLERLNLNFNRLYKLTAQEIEILSNKVNGSTPVFLGVQTESDINNLVAGTKFVVYNLQNSDVEQLNVKASYFEGNLDLAKSDFYAEGENNLICQTLGIEQVEFLYVPAGKIKFEFFSNDTKITKDNFPAKSLSDIVESFSTKISKVALPSPSYTLKSNGNVVTNTYQEGDVTVEFKFLTSNIPNIIDVNDNLNGAKLYSGFDRKYSEDVQNTLTINSNGTFECNAIAVFDGIESARASVSITRKNMSGIIWGLVIIVLLFVVGSAVYFTVKWVREGANVAPLTQKEIFNANRRKEKKYGRERQSKYGQLDASLRNKERAALNADDLTEQDLNKSVDTSYYNNNKKEDIINDFDDDYRRFNSVDYNSYNSFGQDEDFFSISNEQENADDNDEFGDLNNEGPEDIY